MVRIIVRRLHEDRSLPLNWVHTALLSNIQLVDHREVETRRLQLFYRRSRIEFIILPTTPIILSAHLLQQLHLQLISILLRVRMQLFLRSRPIKPLRTNISMLLLQPINFLCYLIIIFIHLHTRWRVYINRLLDLLVDYYYAPIFF